MDFTVPEELRALRKCYGTFLDREVRPIEEALLEDLTGLDPDRDRLYEGALAVRRRSAEEGFYACYLPEDGRRLGRLDAGHRPAGRGRRALRAPARPADPRRAQPVRTDAAAAAPARAPAGRRTCDPVVRAEKTTCFALTEPEAGSDAQAIRTSARRDGDEWVIDGMKHYITNGDKADFAVVFAVTDKEKRADGGITAFVVPREQYRVGKVQATMADAHPSELWFDGSRVPADHVIGEVGRGFQAAMTFLNGGRAGFAAQSLGLAELCLDQAVAHARTRTAFGQPLAANQGVSFPLAECKAEIEAMRWMTYHLAWATDQADGPARRCARLLDREVLLHRAGLRRRRPLPAGLRRHGTAARGPDRAGAAAPAGAAGRRGRLRGAEARHRPLPRPLTPFTGATRLGGTASRVSTCKEEGDPRRVTDRGQDHRSGRVRPQRVARRGALPAVPRRQGQRRQGVVGLLPGLPPRRTGRPRTSSGNGAPATGREPPPTTSPAGERTRAGSRDAARRRRSRARAGGPEAGRRPGQPAGVPRRGQPTTGRR